MTKMMTTHDDRELAQAIAADLARMDADTAEKAEACGVAADFTPAEKKARRIAKIDLQIEAVRERTSDECFVALITDRGW
jgi:hypothetical protein